MSNSKPISLDYEAGARFTVGTTRYGMRAIDHIDGEIIDILLKSYPLEGKNTHHYLVKTVDGVWVNEDYLRDEDVRMVFMSKSFTAITKKEEMYKLLGAAE